jgi:propionate CoA-transferase
VAGPGGFINITQNSKRVVFCGMFAIGSEEVIENGKLRITKQGDGKKFVERVEQITFSGAFAARKKFPVLFITERGVFRLEDQKLILTEIAPGIDLEKDIFGMMDFKPMVSPDLKPMENDLFQPKWGKLEELLERNSGEKAADSMLEESHI